MIHFKCGRHAKQDMGSIADRFAQKIKLILEYLVLIQNTNLAFYTHSAVSEMFHTDVQSPPPTFTLIFSTSRNTIHKLAK
jgi:hypothetical protein